MAFRLVVIPDDYTERQFLVGLRWHRSSIMVGISELGNCLTQKLAIGWGYGT